MTVCDRGGSCKYFIDLRSEKQKMEQNGGERWQTEKYSREKILEGHPEQRNSWRSARLR